MALFSEVERRTLNALCSTFVPSLGSPFADALPHKFESVLVSTAEAGELSKLRLFFRLLENPILNTILIGETTPFSTLSQTQREAVLLAWSRSRLKVARRAFMAVKRLILFLAYASDANITPHPLWVELNYHLPSTSNAKPTRTIQPLKIMQPTTLYADVLVIGSGAGGGVVAGELALAGYDVVVLEKGGFHTENDFDGRELPSTQRLFERQGSLQTADGTMLVLAGSTLGGGTEVNWSVSLRTPDTVLDEWARDYGFTDAASTVFQDSLDAVSARIGIIDDECAKNAIHTALERGCAALGYAVKSIPRNVNGCEDCGFCNFGCAFGAKQSTRKTYLQDAYDQSARIIVGAHVKRVLHQNGAVTGAAATVTVNGAAYPLTVHAKTVVVAAGAIHTPALLLRSGLTNPNIGANLHLHPSTLCYGLFEEAMCGWQGAAMTRYSDTFADLDGRGYGFRLETAPIHPGLAAMTLPWTSASAHHHLMRRLGYLSNVIALTRDADGGRVTVDRGGATCLHYQLSQRDTQHLMRGVIESLRVQWAAGAYEVGSPHNNHLYYRRDGDEDFDAYLQRVARAGLRPNTYALYSAHQMSSCRVGGDAATGAIKPNGETYEVRGLYVADASAMPTATGVNPMLSIMATAHLIAQGLKTK